MFRRGFFACDFVGGSAHYLGSLGHELSDADSFASWGADYLKVGGYEHRLSFDSDSQLR